MRSSRSKRRSTSDDLFFGGKVRIKIGLPWPLPDIKKDIPFSWGDASALPPPVTPLVDGATVSPGYSVVGERFYERETGAVGQRRAAARRSRYHHVSSGRCARRGPGLRRRSISRSLIESVTSTTATR